MFKKMEKDGHLIADDLPGIYKVIGLTDLPFQIIITGELQGEEYAAYRALTDKADEEDVKQVIDRVRNEQDDTVREYYREFINLVMEKNPQYIDMIRRDKEIADVLMDIVKDRVEERVATERNMQQQETTLNHIKDLMRNLSFTVEQAMDALNIPREQRDIYSALVKQGA